MAFDVKSFLDKYGIEYVTRGPNVARHHVAVQCPLCGRNDPSHHMGIDVRTAYWGCWRDKTHRGKSPYKLVMLLLGCSYREAKSIVGSDGRDTGGMMSAVEGLYADEEEKEYDGADALEFPKGIYRIKNEGVRRRFVEYLVGRGFRRKDIPKLVKRYGLRCGLKQRWYNRLIIPVYIDGMLITWTARSIYKDAVPRYLTLPYSKEKAEESGLPQAVDDIKNTLLNFDKLKRYGGKTLFLTEGPLDALKVDFYGSPLQYRATCLFGTSLSDDQLYLIDDVASEFDEVILLLDANATTQILQLDSALSHIKHDTVFLPDYIEDPGDLTRIQVRRLCWQSL